jgi:cytidylate kinase
MPYSVITIARTMGAGGEDLGSSVADELGFRYVDSEIIDRAAALAKVTPDEVAKTEARKGLMTRILENLARAGAAGSLASGGMAEAPILTGELGYEQVIVDVIRETADMGYVVIVAHGAAIPLAGRPDVFRILVTASTDTRAKRVAAEQGIDHGKASRAIEESDKARADFLRRFYSLDRELPTHYDLVVNTDVLPPDQAAAGILAILRH